MIVGYARTSTAEQEAGLQAQVRDLSAVGCEKIFKEQVSSVDRDRRVKLTEALDFLREGDVLVVTKMDRLARSVAHMLDVLGQITAKGASIRILGSDGIDTTTPTGRMMVTMLGAVAEFERAIMLERQREGIAKAKAEGRYKGRKPTAMAKADLVKALHAEGVKPTEIASRLGIGRASVYRALDKSEVT